MGIGYSMWRGGGTNHDGYCARFTNMTGRSTDRNLTFLFADAPGNPLKLSLTFLPSLH